MIHPLYGRRVGSRYAIKSSHNFSDTISVLENSFAFGSLLMSMGFVRGVPPLRVPVAPAKTRRRCLLRGGSASNLAALFDNMYRCWGENRARWNEWLQHWEVLLMGWRGAGVEEYPTGARTVSEVSFRGIWARQLQTAGINNIQDSKQCEVCTWSTFSTAATWTAVEN